VSRIEGDDLGNLWIGTRQGIHRVSRDDLHAVAAGVSATVKVTRFDGHDGMKTAECSTGMKQPSGCRTRDRRIWFTTPKGLVGFDPAHLRQNELVPPVTIEEVRTDRAVAGPGGPIRLPAGTDRVEVHYAALSFLVPDRVRFRYRLDGVDTRWTEAD